MKGNLGKPYNKGQLAVGYNLKKVLMQSKSILYFRILEYNYKVFTCEN